MPAQFGVPWHDAQRLSLSFIPDGTMIAGHASNLFQTLDAQLPQADWQRLILEAFQTWAVQAEVNFSVVPDGGEPLGTPGPDQHDPRFGDIRIGAQPMAPDVLAIAVPHDPFLSGTWSGDVLLNSTILFNGRNASLLPVMLHEVGHVLGLDHSSDPSSVMFSHLNNQATILAPSDVAAVQALYGPRLQDAFEGSQGNDTLATATPFPTPTGFDGTTPLFLYADISSTHDADIFSLQAPAGYSGPATFRLQSAGVSLLAPRLTVYDASGNVVADVASTSVSGDTLLVSLPQVEPGMTYYVEARGATGDVFGVGQYALAVTFDARSKVTPDAIDALARQSYGYLSPDDINAVFLDPRNALFHNDGGANDTFATAEFLKPIDATYGSSAPVRITASLGDAADVDVYSFETPEEDDGSPDGPLVMTVTVRATEVNGIMPGVSVFDAQGNPVPALVLAHGDGTYTIQVAKAQPDTLYFARVTADPTSGKTVGNYDLDVEFGRVAADPTTFVTSTLSPAPGPLAEDLVVNEPQLFDFLLAVPGGAVPGASVTFTLTDSAGRVVLTRTAIAGATIGGDSVLLGPGDYRATFAIQGPKDVALSFRLYGASLTDPIGPALDDPTLAPIGNPSTAGSGAPVPPGIGSSDAPYTWLAVTLAAPQAPGSALPETARADSPSVPLTLATFGPILNVPAGVAVQAAASLGAAVGPGGEVLNAALVGYGRGTVVWPWEVTIGLESSLGTSADVSASAVPVLPSDVDSPVEPVDAEEADEAVIMSAVPCETLAVPPAEVALGDAWPQHVAVASLPANPEAAATDRVEESPGAFVVCLTALVYGGSTVLRQRLRPATGPWVFNGPAPAAPGVRA